jgi:hypothetical protein
MCKFQNSSPIPCLLCLRIAASAEQGRQAGVIL